MLNIVNMLLPLAIWVLIASLIFEEALPGDRQFWLTRPYYRAKLLASKILFLLIIVNVPLFISDCCILGAQGFAVAAVLPEFLLREVPITILFILPSFAIATLTAGLT